MKRPAVVVLVAVGAWVLGWTLVGYRVNEIEAWQRRRRAGSE